MKPAHFQVSALAGLLVVARLDLGGEASTVAAVPAVQADALTVVAERVLRAAGHEPSAEDSSIFAASFLGQFGEQRSGLKTLRGDIIADWIAKRRRGTGEARA